MLTLLAAVAAASFAPPTPWALNFAAPPRIPAVGDVDNDGYADLIVVYPHGEGILDLSLNVEGMKPGRPFQGLVGWGKEAAAVVSGPFDEAAGDDVLALVGQELHLAGGYSNGKMVARGVVAKLPGAVKSPRMWRDAEFIVVADPRGRGYRLKPGEWESVVVRDALPTPHGLAVPETSVVAFGDVDKDGDDDAFEFAYGTEKHTAYQVRLHRNISAGETDSDADGISNAEEAGLKTDPLNSDTDGDGLHDGWEVGSFRGMNFKEMGCDPRRIDIICLVHRFDDVDEGHFRRELTRVQDTYSKLPVNNPDGSTGWKLHLIYRDPITGEDKAKPWYANRDQHLPREWRGIAHWMQVSNGGGGQADQLGDGGGCGANALWAVFLHEFGHQLGMDHNGHWGPGLCPIYRSLMNYAYSYSLEDDYNKIAYSTGELNGYTLNETNLDETIPLPYEKVKFLEKGPYRFRLKPNGDTTLIDWNWNGVFGEKGIRADINYSYSTNAGLRDEMARTMTSPWLFTHRNRAYALFGERPKAAKGENPDITPEKPGELKWRKLIKPTVWEKPITLADDLVGDPAAIASGAHIALVYPSKVGVRWQLVTPAGKPVGKAIILDPNPKMIPTVGQVGDRSFVFLWNPDTQEVGYRVWRPGQTPGPERRLYERSTVPVGMAVDTVRKEVVIAMAQDQDAARPSRWQIRRYRESYGHLAELGMEWIDGEAGQSRGRGRLRALFKVDKDTGPGGRLYVYGRGYHGDESPWACTYVAETIADKSIRGGWLVKRFYDEWTQSRSAPAATWWNGDILWAYRWIDGGNPDRDNLLHVGYRALGIDEEPMGDHDDLTFMRDFGIRHSILYLNRP